mmetsp:Transcript_2384/g.4505  ORF Transcript_2384/g.4505 Transcript_2384/m.4505 type:complete len:223 (-) Transcript_2384:232-900(-)
MARRHGCLLPLGRGRILEGRGAHADQRLGARLRKPGREQDRIIRVRKEHLPPPALLHGQHPAGVLLGEGRLAVEPGLRAVLRPGRLPVVRHRDVRSHLGPLRDDVDTRPVLRGHPPDADYPGDLHRDRRVLHAEGERVRHRLGGLVRDGACLWGIHVGIALLLPLAAVLDAGGVRDKPQDVLHAAPVVHPHRDAGGLVEPARGPRALRDCRWARGVRRDRER